MAKNLYEAESLAEFVELLKNEQGDSYDTLGAKIGVSPSTLNRIVNGKQKSHNTEDFVIDKIADYAGVGRPWLYALVKQIPARPKYPPRVAMIAALLEEAPESIQEDVLAMARALIQSRKKQATKEDQ